MRLDLALADRGLARSRTHAQRLIAQGRVRLDGVAATKAATPIGPDAELTVDEDRYVSRAAHKLLGVLGPSGVRVPARVLDAGASTGGFTQVVLERGAARVYAVDVGHGQLAPTLRSDPRVVVVERTNLRDLTLAHVEGGPVGLVVADVSFISLRLVLAPMLSVLAPDGEALVLVKPQFEVGRAGLDGHGVVRDAKLRQEALDQVIADAEVLGWRAVWTGESPLPGTAGNIEHFVRLGRPQTISTGRSLAGADRRPRDKVAG